MYAVRTKGNQRIVKGYLTVRWIEVHSGATGQAPTAATYALAQSDGTAIVAASNATLGARVTYSLPALATSSLDPEENCIETWDCTMADGERVIYRRKVAIVLRNLYAPVVDADLSAIYAELGEQRNIPARQGGTWEAQREAAWLALAGRLWAAGADPQRVISGEELWEVHLAESLALICDLLHPGGDRSKWQDRRDYQQVRAAEAWKRLVLDLDLDEDGLAETGGDGVTRWSADTSPTGAPAIAGRDW